MGIVQSLEQRRTYYKLTKELPVEEKQVLDMIKKVTELTPDAFDMRSSRVIVALGEKNQILWDTITALFDNAIAPYKLECFRGSYGTILYFYDNRIVKGLQEQHPIYSASFPDWAMQASAMLQLGIWCGLRDMDVAASLHHYNPVIDEKVKELFDLPEDYKLIAQMPFGGIGGDPRIKEKEDIQNRVKIFK